MFSDHHFGKVWSQSHLPSLYFKSFDRQFKDAARDRYFKTDADTNYFHSMMSDFFLGKWGGGTPKPFKFTEIQKHRFQLKSKDSEADRQVHSEIIGLRESLSQSL